MRVPTRPRKPSNRQTAMAGILACSRCAPPSRSVRVEDIHSDDKNGTPLWWNLQQRDCPGLTPGSLLSE